MNKSTEKFLKSLEKVVIGKLQAIKRKEILKKLYLEKAKKHIGNIIGSFKLLKLSHSYKARYFFICKCIYCSDEKIIAFGSIPFRKSCGCLSRKNNQNERRKLSDIEVKSIRDLHNTDLYTRDELSKQFNVSLGCIRSVIKRITWKNVE